MDKDYRAEFRAADRLMAARAFASLVFCLAACVAVLSAVVRCAGGAP